MSWQIVNILLFLIAFSVFACIQALIINGVYDCFSGGCVNDIKEGKKCSGYIFYMIAPSFFEKHRGKWWTKNLWGCVKCMSSIYGAVTFWPTVLFTFGFNLWQIPVFIADIFVLVYLTYYFYKK